MLFGSLGFKEKHKYHKENITWHIQVYFVQHMPERRHWDGVALYGHIWIYPFMCWYLDNDYIKAFMNNFSDEIHKKKCKLFWWCNTLYKILEKMNCIIKAQHCIVNSCMHINSTQMCFCLWHIYLFSTCPMLYHPMTVHACTARVYMWCIFPCHSEI